MNFEEITNSIQTKLGTENIALIADDLANLTTYNSKLTSDLQKRDESITKLKNEKENLITVNGNLLQKINMGVEEQPVDNKEKSTTKEFSFYDMFDEKGKLKNKL